MAASLKPRGPERAPRPGCRVHPGFPASAAPSRAPGAETRTHQSASAAARPWLSVWSPPPPSARQPWGGESSRRPLPARAARRPPPRLAEAGLGWGQRGAGDGRGSPGTPARNGRRLLARAPMGPARPSQPWSPGAVLLHPARGRAAPGAPEAPPPGDPLTPCPRGGGDPLTSCSPGGAGETNP